MPQDAAQDVQWMRVALAQAQAADHSGEVPVGAVVVRNGQIIGVGRNAPIGSHDPSAHAEMAALRAAALHLGNYRLDECELFVTLEPCAMCAGAMLHARLKRVVFGATDPKTGAAGSVIDLFDNAQLNHHTRVQGGVLAQACAELLQGFFRQQRQKKSLHASPLREDALRTPTSRFKDLPPMPGVSTYVDDLPSLQGLRLHYVDAGPRDSTQVILALHGSGSWSQVWLPVMAERAAHGVRMLAPDLIGFGKSDKPKKESAHQLHWHAQVLCELLERLDLHQLRVLEPDDAVQDHGAAALTGQSVGQLLMAMAGPRVFQRESCALSPLTAAAVLAPYPDVGHRAAWRAFAHQPRPAALQATKKNT